MTASPTLSSVVSNHSRCSGDRLLGAALLGDVAKRENHAEGASRVVEDRRGAVGDRTFGPITTDQHAVVREADDLPGAEDQTGRVVDSLAGRLVDDLKHVRQRLSLRALTGPAGQRFRRPVEVNEATAWIRRDHRIADTPERHAKPFLLRRQFTRQALLFGDIACDFGDADDGARLVANRRHRE